MTLPGRVWGATAAEVAATQPCDGLIGAGAMQADRAISVAAPPSLVFRWLCQLRAAPYSYDLLDNLGRRSPQQLTPGLDALELGQRFMTIFRLVSFAPGQQLTLRSRRVAVTYALRPEGEGTRLAARVLYDGPLGSLLALGDLVMMRRQLLNLKALAERDALRPRASAR